MPALLGLLGYLAAVGALFAGAAAAFLWFIPAPIDSKAPSAQARQVVVSPKIAASRERKTDRTGEAQPAKPLVQPAVTVTPVARLTADDLEPVPGAGREKERERIKRIARAKEKASKRMAKSWQQPRDDFTFAYAPSRPFYNHPLQEFRDRPSN